MLLKPTPLAHARGQAGLFSLTALASVFVPGGAMAQQTLVSQERIEVTGSNIKRTAVEGPAPVQVITREDIARNAKGTVGEMLRDLSANSGGSYSESSINNQSGAAGISLRTKPWVSRYGARPSSLP